MKKFLTSEEAIELLPEGEEIHTFYNLPFGLVGADWEREDIIERLNNPNYKIEVCGEAARAMNHGICVYKKGETIQSNILFIETNMDKLNEIDPLPEKKEERATVSEKFVSLDAYKQVRWERDIAIQQLHELGYEFGQKIEPTPKNDLGVDCISRQAAIDAIRRIHPIDTDYDCTLFDKVDVMYVLNDLPSVTSQEPRKGHWIETAEEYYKAINEKGGGVNENTDYFVDDIACSECLAKFSVIDNEAERFDFCPCCGSDNK